jgi:hypothetical protein
VNSFFVLCVEMQCTHICFKAVIMYCSNIIQELTFFYQTLTPTGLTSTIGAASDELDEKEFVARVSFLRREIITVREQSYVSRLPKYCPPTPLSARRVFKPQTYVLFRLLSLIF